MTTPDKATMAEIEPLSKVELTYLALLLLPHNALRLRLQPELAACRDAIALATDKGAEDVQNDFGARAADLLAAISRPAPTPAEQEQRAEVVNTGNLYAEYPPEIINQWDGCDHLDCLAECDTLNGHCERLEHFLRAHFRQIKEPERSKLRGWARAYREGPAEHRFPSDPHAEFFPQDMERCAEALESALLAEAVTTLESLRFAAVMFAANDDMTARERKDLSERCESARTVLAKIKAALSS